MSTCDTPTSATAGSLAMLARYSWTSSSSDALTGVAVLLTDSRAFRDGGWDRGPSLPFPCVETGAVSRYSRRPLLFLGAMVQVRVRCTRTTLPDIAA